MLHCRDKLERDPTDVELFDMGNANRRVTPINLISIKLLMIVIYAPLDSVMQMMRCSDRESVLPAVLL
jgi:hypothetical protein